MKNFEIFGEVAISFFYWFCLAFVACVLVSFTCISIGDLTDVNIITKKTLVEEKSADRVILTDISSGNIYDEIKRTTSHVKYKKFTPANSPQLKIKLKYTKC